MFTERVEANINTQICPHPAPTLNNDCSLKTVMSLLEFLFSRQIYVYLIILLTVQIAGVLSYYRGIGGDPFDIQGVHRFIFLGKNVAKKFQEKNTFAQNFQE